MNCQDIQEIYWEYQRNQLAANLMGEAQQHLKTCPACASLFENLKQVDLELDRLNEIEPSPYFDQKLLAKLDELERRPIGLSNVVPWFKARPALSFALLLITTVAIWVGHRHHQAQKLNSIAETVQLQQKVPGHEGISNGQTTTLQPGSSSHVGEEDAIPEEDLAVVQNFDLLQNYDFIKKFDFADTQAEVRQTVNPH